MDIYRDPLQLRNTYTRRTRIQIGTSTHNTDPYTPEYAIQISGSIGLLNKWAKRILHHYHRMSLDHGTGT